MSSLNPPGLWDLPYEAYGSYFQDRLQSHQGTDHLYSFFAITIKPPEASHSDPTFLQFAAPQLAATKLSIAIERQWMRISNWRAFARISG